MFNTNARTRNLYNTSTCSRTYNIHYCFNYCKNRESTIKEQQVQLSETNVKYSYRQNRRTIYFYANHIVFKKVAYFVREVKTG